MPISLTAIFRSVVVLLMAAHVLYFYSFARSDQETVGIDPATMLAASSFALVMLVPLAWAVVLPDVPVIIRTQVGRRRWEQGLCAACGHSLLAAGGAACPECGVDRTEPPAFQFGWGTLRRFALLALLAWVLGCAGAETWAALDETSFAREAAARVSPDPTDPYSRPRRWPMQAHTLYYTAADGVTAYSPRVVLPEPPGYPAGPGLRNR